MSDYKISTEIKTCDDKVNLLFHCDGGKFKTHEMLDEFTLTPEELLDILQAHEESKSNISEKL